jgi:predicted nucleotide-binding protein (sugar kinase/HSP70/actin superfamily)
MTVTFPHMGNTYVCIKALLDDLGVRYVIPPFPNRSALELGTRYVPEGACLPLKITVGSLIQGYEKGADTHLMLGSWGPCRFGYYCQMQREILRNSGCHMDTIILEGCREGLGELTRRIRRLAGGRFPVFKVAKALWDVPVIAVRTDKLERLYYRVMARERRRGSAEAIYSSFQRSVLATRNAGESKRLFKQTKKKLLAVDIDESAEPLRIGIVGEIFGTIDPWTNLRLQSRLCCMGIETERLVTVSEWIVEKMIKRALHIPQRMAYARAAYPYVRVDIGGHTRETIGHTVIHSRQGFDGIIQVYPLGCMPEIVAQAMMPKVSREQDIPVLTLIIDEMTGEAGYMTRVEAFVDLLNQRRRTAATKTMPLGEYA